MYLKLKSALAFLSFVGTSAYAVDSTIVTARAPSNALMRKGGQTAALNNGGVAHVIDLSAIDSNPAALAQGRELALYSEMQWHGENSQSVEVGVVDSMMSEVAAGLKARQTSLNSGGID